MTKEIRTNVALRISPSDVPNIFNVSGRGEMQIAILVEQMRREGLEFMVGRPEVLLRTVNGVKEEPLERLTLDLPEEFSSDVTRMFQERKGLLMSYEVTGTQSGPQAEQGGSLMELSKGGKQPVTLPGGLQRSFLQDGDSVLIRASCSGQGAVRLGFGECRGTVLPALP